MELSSILTEISGREISQVKFMELFTTFLIGVGLSADAFAVALSSGLTIKYIKLNKALKIALFFGGFQAIMPIIGWGVGQGLVQWIAGIDHWIAFGLLSAIGVKMIYEACQDEADKDKNFDPLDTYTLLILSVATSIDALAVGLSFAILKISILKAAAMIGVTTFILSLMAVFIGHKFGNLFRDKIEVMGGLTLIFIGLKILIEHLTA